VLADKIRSKRRDRGITIAQLAGETGFSSGYISSVERGLVNPSLSALLKITSALEIDPGFLFEGYNPSNHQDPIVRKDERLTLVYPGSNIHYELLTRGLRTRKVEFLRVTIPVGKGSGPRPLVHDGEEYGLVLKGRMELQLGDEVHLLEEGDSIAFPSTIPHGVTNVGDIDVEAIWAMTPPNL